MATQIQTQIASARKAGYSDQEIFQGILKSPKYGNGFERARAAGHSNNDIAQGLGLNLGDTQKLQIKDGKAKVEMQPIKTTAKAPSKTESFIVGAANDIGGGINQGVSQLKDMASNGLNSVFGTNLDTGRYNRVTRETKAVNDQHEKRRTDAGKTGTDGWRVTGNIAGGMALTPSIGGSALSVVGKSALSGAGLGGVTFAESGEKRLSNMAAGAVGGAVGGIAGRGIEKISQKATQKIAQKATQKALDAPKNTLTTNARNTGYSVPPSYSNPNFINKSLAKVAGEADLARIASAKNQQVTNNLARKSIGLADDQPITVEALGEVRKQAGQAYKVLKGFGDIQTDRKFAKDLTEITKNYTSAGRDFNVAGGDRIQNIVKQVRGDRFGSDAALNMIKIARNDASAAFRAGDTDLGLANQKLASAIEGQLERAVVQNTKVPRAAVANFINARKVIAKTYSIENALDATGNVSARKLASTLGKKPLTAELKQAAQFSQTYPQLNNIGVHGGNGITLFDSLVGIGGGVATGNPAVAALTLGRPALKAGLNSTTAGKLMGTPSYSSALLQLMGQSRRVAPVLPVVGATVAKEKNKSKSN